MYEWLVSICCNEILLDDEYDKSVYGYPKPGICYKCKKRTDCFTEWQMNKIIHGRSDSEKEYNQKCCVLDFQSHEQIWGVKARKPFRSKSKICPTCKK